MLIYEIFHHYGTYNTKNKGEKNCFKCLGMEGFYVVENQLIV